MRRLALERHEVPVSAQSRPGRESVRNASALAQALISSRNTVIVSILANQAKNSQILRNLSQCDEQC